MVMTPVWQVDEWTLPASLRKIDQQWMLIREILNDPALYDLRDASVSGWSCGEHTGHVTMAR